MSTSEERLKILNMIAEGKISAGEGAQLLRALREAGRSNQRAAGGPVDTRHLRVRVINAETGKVKVNISIPISLVQVALRMGARFVPDLEFEFDDIMEAIRQGARGKIVEVEDHTDGERVEIFVE